MVCMPGGRAGSSEAQPISCHIDEVTLFVELLIREFDVVVELVSITQFEILEEDALESVIPLVSCLLPSPLLLPFPTVFCTELLGTVTNCAVARLPSAVFT